MSWRRQTTPARDWRTMNDNLAPIVTAELSRGNALLPPGGWQEVVTPDGRGEREWRLELRFALDTEAVEAEFALPDGMYTRAGALVWGQLQYHLIVGEQVADEQRQAAVADWWARWRAAGGPRTVIAALPSNVVVVGNGPDAGRPYTGAEDAG